MWPFLALLLCEARRLRFNFKLLIIVLSAKKITK